MTVIVGIGLSEPRQPPLDWAIASAAARAEPLEIVTSWQVRALPPFLEGSVETDESRIEAAVTEANADAVALAVDAGVEVNGTVTRTAAGPALADAAERASLVVVGTHSHGAVAGLLVGSVSQYLAHNCPVPLLVAAGDYAPPHRIVVGVDGSPGSRRALVQALVMARAHNARLEVVVATMDHDQFLVPGSVLSGGEGLIRDWLRHFVADEASVDVPVEYRVGHVKPYQLLLSTPGDVVVVGSRGVGGFEGLTLGSTSNRVLHHSRRPVLLVPSLED